MAAVHAVSHVLNVNNSMQMQLSFILQMALLRVTVMLMRSQFTNSTAGHLCGGHALITAGCKCSASAHLASLFIIITVGQHITLNQAALSLFSIKHASNKAHSNIGNVMLLADAPVVSTAADGIHAAGQVAAYDDLADTAATLAADRALDRAADMAADK